jgi:hypothetical protein
MLRKFASDAVYPLSSTEFLLSLYITESVTNWAYSLLLALLAVMTHAALKQRSGLRPIQKEVDTVNFHISKMAESLAETNSTLLPLPSCAFALNDSFPSPFP